MQFMIPTATDNCRYRPHKDGEMDTKAKLLNPATIAALLLFAGGTGAAPAVADDHADFGTNEGPSEEIEDISIEQARQANQAAVEEAARSVEADTRLDLDIRLIGRNSVNIADEV